MRTLAFFSIPFLALAAQVGPLTAQTATSDRVAKVMAQQRTVLPPACKAAVSGGGKINDIVSDLRAATGQSDPAKRTADLTNVRQKLEQAIQTGNQGSNAAAWIYLGRTDLYAGDVVGADTAFSHAEKIAPDCKDETDRWRQLAWAPLVKDGIGFANGNQPDSARMLFQQANSIYRGSPSAYLNLGVLSANQGHNDTAATYFKQAADIAATDTSFAEEQRFATLNLGIVLNRTKKYDEAIATLEQYRKMAPNDTIGGRSLHAAYCGANQTDKAQALEKQQNLPPCAVAGGDAGNLVEKGVAAFNANKFVEAADLFGQAYAKQPYNHDALLNQATSYFKSKNGPKLVEAATPLVALEPMNEVALQLLEQGYKETKQLDKQVATVTRRRALPVKLETKSIAISPTDIKIGMQATGRDARDAKDVALKAAPVNLTFEMLGADGAVVATQDLTVPPLAAGATQDVTVTAQANGINGWRYKVKS
jgi:tetratricopeptide (TPR) repeat protein